MSALERLERLPDWPARMTAPVAAAYMDDSPNNFLSKYGTYGRREGGKVYWSRAQLDQLILAQFGLADAAAPGSGMDSEYDRWKAGRSKGK